MITERNYNNLEKNNFTYLSNALNIVYYLLIGNSIYIVYRRSINLIDYLIRALNLLFYGKRNNSPALLENMGVFSEISVNSLLLLAGISQIDLCNSCRPD